MNDIILSHNSGATISSIDFRDVINQFRANEGQSPVRNDQFISRIESEVDDLGVCKTIAHPQSGVEMRYYDLNQDQMLLVGMRESKTVRKQVLSWLHKLAESSAPKLPATFAEALQMAADQAKQLEEQAPKVEFVDRYVESIGNKTFRETCKILKANERKFRAFLSEKKIMYQVSGNWVPYQNHIASGRFYVTTGTANEHAYTSAKFTPKGLEWVSRLWRESIA